MKTIKLSRVSTPEQKKSNLSLPAQGHRIDKYAITHNLEDWKEFEIDETAWKTNRAKFGQVIELLQKSKEPIALVCDKIDRLIRNFTKDLAILEELRLAGKLELHFPSDNIILHKNSPAADLFRWSIGIALAKYYSDAISDNVKRAIEQKLRNGEWITKEKYDTLLEKYKRIQADTLLQMEQHSKADENYYVEASKLLELAHRAYGLFEISEATQKRELLSFLLQNCKMDGKKLIPSLKMPFDQILLANKTQNWLKTWDSYRRIDWINEIEYPEFTYQETQRFLSEKFLRA